MERKGRWGGGEVWKKEEVLDQVPAGGQGHWQVCGATRVLGGRAGASAEERGDGGWGLAGLFSELLSLSASAKLLNWYHILEGASPGCQEETEREGLDLWAEALNLLRWDRSRLFKP